MLVNGRGRGFGGVLVMLVWWSGGVVWAQEVSGAARNGAQTLLNSGPGAGRNDRARAGDY